MYVIIVYDVNVERVNQVKKFLRRYLTWIQNSVFEGELSEADLEEVKLGLSDIIDGSEDMVVIYRLPSNRSLKKDVLGIDKSCSSEII
ncbi:CRISPR-associated endonuclease Cas2 [Archaeoglobus veneficus]|uniref:CRISPR-associated endoribonuclease Cas2 n=1 Tax=Archaeoglobus veneficus (strain DSM 11195 / SNP6) TaxID=693661 RepID=F2KRM9_ARCVS|nr:CRISPR-associated endonuclease Cas2 [Archaeoglobus veneficus]AEA46794.1 CRISPR-associated protein Cas2 [Archaeoglobus veneficus SNP6]